MILSQYVRRSAEPAPAHPDPARHRPGSRSRRIAGLLRSAAGSGLAALLTACASSGPEPPPPITFAVTSDYRANGGRLMYFYVRNVNEKQFMMDSYQDVAAKAFADPPDPSVLGVYSLVPGSEQEVTLSQPSQGALALYFLFTEPGTQWKKLLEPPLADCYDVVLPGNNQVQISEHRSFWSRLW